jgi:hypothetical protein
MNEREKAEFIAENPDSWLNPDNPRYNRHRYGLDHLDQPPAAPGTLAFQEWYKQRFLNQQPGNWGSGGNGGYEGYAQYTQQQGPGPGGMYAPAMAQGQAYMGPGGVQPGYGYTPQMSQIPPHPMQGAGMYGR